MICVRDVVEKPEQATAALERLRLLVSLSMQRQIIFAREVRVTNIAEETCARTVHDGHVTRSAARVGERSWTEFARKRLGRALQHTKGNRTSV